MFTALNPYMLWIKLAGVAVLMLGSAYGAHYVTKAVDDRALAAVQLADSKAQTANVTASLSQLQGFIASMHAADANYNATLADINNSFVVIKKDFNNATHAALPADCRPDVARLRVLTAAVSAANHAAAPIK